MSTGIRNVSAQRTSDGGVYVQYLQDGVALDSVHTDWQAFIAWFQIQVDKETERVRKVAEEVRARDTG